MVKKRLIEVVTISVDDKLDQNGALRNVAVKDAWQRLRQKIDVEEWKAAEKVLNELTMNLQKINMYKSVSGACGKLRNALQNPEQLVDEAEFLSATPTPRDRGDSPQALQAASDLKKTKDELSQFCSCLEKIKASLEKDNQLQDKIEPPPGVAPDIAGSYKALAFICDRCQRGLREIDHLKKRVDNCEARSKELEKHIDEKEEAIDKLTKTVNTLEKKHSTVKEGKIDNIKEQMKMKSLEKQVEAKVAEVNKIRAENANLNKRLNEIKEQMGSELADMYNTHPPARIADLYRELFAGGRNDAFQFYKTSMSLTAKDAAVKTMAVLQDAFSFCEEASKLQFGLVLNSLITPTESFDGKQPPHKVDDNDMSQIQNVRKQTSRLSCEHVKNAFVTKLESSGDTYSMDELTGCMAFIEQCVELCWYMCMQTPPLFIGFSDNMKQDIAVDKTKYEIASGKGAKVDFVLWPPLYGQKDGDVISKGVIQTK
ncbi:uncharacterized protein LOC128237043 [Mya arenaria]|uniref:uncharacterized protein LOC128237043 n=1 Tax=Mya arenaria TaxID=6604 RepID=UPI0022E2C55A|nr:uncharacterized protein LOC128237043 [Mya arenaria]